MSEIDKLINNIEVLRKKLNDLISKKDFNLQDEEMIKASQELDIAISKYNDLINKKM